MYNLFLKRIIDISFSILILLFFPIIYIGVGILIKLDDSGPIFYKSNRIGRNFKQFSMFKFRTMKVDAPDLRNQDGTTFNAIDDPRQTKIGKFLRKTSLDEIPQFINVLRGDMSLIGPRPSPIGNFEKYSDDYKRKFSLRPGITGYNQAKLRNNATLEEKIKNDLFYADNISFFLDLKILFLTVINVLKAKNINVHY